MALSFLFALSLPCLYSDSGAILPDSTGGLGSAPHYLFLIDTSYSMGLRMPFHTRSQWQLAAENLSEYLGKVDGKYALSEFADTGSFRIVVPFTSSKSLIRAALRAPVFWEATDIQDAVTQAAHYIRAYGVPEATEVTIVLVSDGIETRGPLFSLPVISVSQAPHITLELLPVSLPFNRAAEKRGAGWGGTAGPSTAEENRAGASRTGSEPIEYRASSSLQYTEGTGRSWYLILLISFGIVVFGPLIFCSIHRSLRGGAGRGNRSARKPSPPIVQPHSEQHYVMRFIEYHRREGNHERRMELQARGDGIPLEIGDRGFKQSDQQNCNALISFEEEGCFINSDTPLLINGVAVRRRKFKPGITILFSGTRFKLIGIERKTVGPPPTSAAATADIGRAAAGRAVSERTAECFKPVLPLSAAGVLIAAVAYAVMSLSGLPFAGSASIRRESRAYLKFVPYDWEREFSLPVVDYGDSARQTDRASDRASGADDGLQMIQGLWNGRRWEFAGLENEPPVDYLFFHAHPDDEALDFGGLLAKLEQSHKRVAVVLFTDGESGLSRGPEKVRGTNAGVLKSIRIEEASRSLRILGADAYIRLGLRNHPYSSQLQFLPIEQVYAAWGGIRRVEAAIEELIVQLKPQVIVSPDGPSDAREHFEHEAVGEAVIRVVERLQQTQSEALPQRHMRLVDPMQQNVYPNFERFDVLRPVWPGFESPRSLQNRALKAHRSQIDARIVGLEYTPLFDSEYYQVRELHE